MNKTASRAYRKCVHSLDLPFEHVVETKFSRHLKRTLGCDVNLRFTDNSSVMISFKKQRDKSVNVRLHKMFYEADDSTIQAVADYLSTRCRDSSHRLSDFIRTNKHLVKKSNAINFSSFVTSGKYFDLKSIFDRLNRLYFDSKLDIAITWGKKSSRRPRCHIRLGSYSFTTKIVRIHPALDKKIVPLFFIESVVYHEMLHASLCFTSKNGRAQYHTSRFREIEKQYPQFEKALAWEKANIHRIF